MAIEDIVTTNIEIPGIVGPVEVASLFAEKWATRKKCKPVMKMDQMIYRLDQVAAIPYSTGRLRLANRADMELVSQWIEDFAEFIDDHSFIGETVCKTAEQ